ncbi:MAG: hypothetical protein JSW27_25780 [Phycisphaerales bacterium]|nr:MAG: hypothetical protein JSW27_25780 [Phycisphaerales bacterium]
MNRLQKMARFNLIAWAVILVLGAVFVALAAANVGAGDVARQLPGVMKMWLLATLAVMVSSECWAKRQQPSRVEFDERDRIIQIRALHCGILALLGVFLWMTWLLAPSEGLVSFWIPVLLGSAAMAGNLVYSTAILIQYGRGGTDGEK